MATPSKKNGSKKRWARKTKNEKKKEKKERKKERKREREVKKIEEIVVPETNVFKKNNP